MTEARAEEERRPASPSERIVFASNILFETPGGVRFTQDSPILPNVWLAYAVEPRSQQELILTTNTDSGSGPAANELQRMIKEERERRPTINGAPRERARLAYIPGQLAVKLYFDELMRIVLPLTPWWHKTYDYLRRIERRYQETADPANWRPFPTPGAKRNRDLLHALMLMRKEIDPSADEPLPAASDSEHNPMRSQYIRDLPPDLSWLVRIAGMIGGCFLTDTQLLDPGSPSEMLKRDLDARHYDRIETSQQRNARMGHIRSPFDEALAARKNIVDSFTQLYEGWAPDDQYPEDRHLWRVTKNRRIHLAVAKSALTVKADAARSLFDISCRNITWAVLDSGIDSNHPAFKLTTEEHEAECRRANEMKAEEAKKAAEADMESSEAGGGPAEEEDGAGAENQINPDELRVHQLDSRVIKTLDFTYLRELLDVDLDGANHDALEAALEAGEVDYDEDDPRFRTGRLLRKIACRMSYSDCTSVHEMLCDPGAEDIEAALPVLARLRERIDNGEEISWQDLEPAIVANNPPTPTNDHGTHVAGILGADWIEDLDHEAELPLAQRTRRMQGICPDINLIDVRVFREDGLTDEFELLAAMQFLRWMNSRAGTIRVHGANLSLSLVHEVRRFACGQTPICDECNEASALGMVVVAAAGNRGFEMTEVDEVRSTDTYKSVSITDPGNAAAVITVGSTHRKRPHEYGVSYFSSRGPTGDGRLKPDLVAPGEKIKGPTPNGRAEFKDGTSMAAPHVSGVAALLMARHGELIGQPARIKQILCDTATDLGRERYFQGNGLVDALRAIQSI